MNSFVKEEKEIKGFLALVLHAHLPFVRHPDVDYMREENWLFEAITETYLPLISILYNCYYDKLRVRFTMSITPTLSAMLSDDLLKERYLRHISKLIELAEKEVIRTSSKKNFNKVAVMYLEKFTDCKYLFEKKIRGDILSAFKFFQDEGIIEIITCGATHGYLPALQINPQAVYAQIAIAIESYYKFFKRKPIGIWLPECGYYEGLEKIIERLGLRYFFTETHGLLMADPEPQYGVYAPIYCKDTSVAAFARDPECSRSVWSATEGYPGDPDYREFYRDIGFDLDFDYIKPYIDPIGIRMDTGIKYYRITGGNKQKQVYNREKALRKAVEHAGNFVFNREKQIQYLASIMDRPPIIVAPYDAELFGHWWYEGPEWLNFVFRKINFEECSFSLITPSEYLLRYPENQMCKPSFSSWGDGGYSEVWIDKSNDWIYPHLHQLEKKMIECAKKYSSVTDLQRRVLNQMARELLLAESSDWAFIIKNGTMVEYAIRRIKEHIANFLRLYEDLNKNNINENFLSLLESHNNIFPEIDYSVYAVEIEREKY